MRSDDQLLMGAEPKANRHGEAEKGEPQKLSTYRESKPTFSQWTMKARPDGIESAYNPREKASLTVPFIEI